MTALAIAINCIKLPPAKSIRLRRYSINIIVNISVNIEIGVLVRGAAVRSDNYLVSREAPWV